MKKIKCAIVGYGKMGHIREKVIRRFRDAEILGVLDPGFHGSKNIKSFASVHELITEQPDAIFICTPNHFIRPLTVRFLSAGFHVFSEKPPGTCLGDALAIHSMAQKKPSQVMMFGFNHRQHGSVLKMKKIVDQGKLGKILWMRGRYGKEVNSDFFQNWRTKRKIAGGGILLDQGIHMVDLFLHFAGDFHQIKAFVTNHFWKLRGIEDNVFAIFKNKNTGVTASLHSTMTQWRYIFSFEVFLEHGCLILNGLKTSSGFYGDEILTIKNNRGEKKKGSFSNEKTIVYQTNESWRLEVEQFFKSIKDKKKPIHGTTAEAVRIMKTIKKIYENGKK